MSNEKSRAREQTLFRLEISGGFLLLLSLSGFLCGFRVPAAAAIAAAAHELGHLAVILRQGGTPKRIRLDISGVCLECAAEEPNVRQEFLRAAAGPAAGLLLWLLLRGSDEAFLRSTASMSLMLSLVNLLPAEGLDGRRALYCLCANAAPSAARETLLRALEWLCAAAAVTIGILSSPQLFLYGLWLILRTAGIRRCD